MRRVRDQKRKINDPFSRRFFIHIAKRKATSVEKLQYLNMTSFWDIVPCSLYVTEVRSAFIIRMMMMGALGLRTSETSVYFNGTTRYYVPEGCHRTRHRENLKSHIPHYLSISVHVASIAVDKLHQTVNCPRPCLNSRALGPLASTITTRPSRTTTTVSDECLQDFGQGKVHYLQVKPYFTM
jgi:hypothetical protein